MVYEQEAAKECKVEKSCGVSSGCRNYWNWDRERQKTAKTERERALCWKGANPC